MSKIILILIVVLALAIIISTLLFKIIGEWIYGKFNKRRIIRKNKEVRE